MSVPRTIFEKIAAIRYPMPTYDEPADETEHDAQADYRDAMLEERERLAGQLEAAWDGADADPLLESLRAAQARKKAADADIRRLIAFGREFVKPRPYVLEDLAEAAGMSYSGVRTAYDRDTIAAVADALGVTLMPASDDPADVRSSDVAEGQAR